MNIEYELEKQRELNIHLLREIAILKTTQKKHEKDIEHLENIFKCIAEIFEK